MKSIEENEKVEGNNVFQFEHTDPDAIKAQHILSTCDSKMDLSKFKNLTEKEREAWVDSQKNFAEEMPLSLKIERY